jgi:hypothetical protein
MRLRRIFTTSATATAMVVTGLAGAVAVASPASAGWTDTCQYLHGNASKGIQVCSTAEIYGNEAWGRGGVRFDAATTTATGCELRINMELNRGSSYWHTVGDLEPCIDSITHPKSWTYVWDYTKTTATRTRSTVCLDLYYNRQSTNPYTKCLTTGWVSV